MTELVTITKYLGAIPQVQPPNQGYQEDQDGREPAKGWFPILFQALSCFTIVLLVRIIEQLTCPTWGPT